MESPSRTPPARSAAEPLVTLTLIERRATFWLFAAGSAAFCAAWISEPSWMVGMQLMLFATWPLRRALGLSLSLTAVLLTGALMVDARTTRPPDWQTVLWPLIVNGCIAQLFFAGALYGVSRQLRRLAALAAPSDGRRVHTV